MKKSKYLVTISNLMAIKKKLLTFPEGALFAGKKEQHAWRDDLSADLFFRRNQAPALCLQAQKAIYLVASQIPTCAPGVMGSSLCTA